MEKSNRIRKVTYLRDEGLKDLGTIQIYLSAKGLPDTESAALSFALKTCVEELKSNSGSTYAKSKRT